MNSLMIQEAKQASLVAYLAANGFNPIKQVGSELLYYSPLRNEQTPSFYVNPQKNCFADFGQSEYKGDTIRFVQLLKGCNFQTAVMELQESHKNHDLSHPFSFSGQSVVNESKIEIRAIREVKNTALIKYVASRGIGIELARLWLKEIHYQTKGKTYFAIGFLNDANGYELRNGLGFKGKTANAIRLVNCQTQTVNLFEGFFDFLSALAYYKVNAPSQTTIILNSTVNLSKALPILERATKINSYLDNDKGGEAALNQLLRKGFNVVNQSNLLYPSCKDFNQYLVNLVK